ncbi:hypothetical protein BKA82DRAFT_4012958 [Pisolithus tinctorius]|nr:hypothetical protein BKA82DRAFT_4012958 [Pisolithus tinctorius]
MSSSSLSHKLFKKSPELNAVANCILQIYFKDIAESSKLERQTRLRSGEDAVHDLIARMDEILMTLISINTFLKWHEDLGSIDHPWPEWKTALAPSKTDLGLPMPCVVPTPTPPTQETEMPMSNKGKWKATEVEVEQMIAEGLHRMEVDNEGEDEAPEKEDNEEEPVRGRQKCQAATKIMTHRSRHQSCSMKATAETIDEDDVPAQGQSKHKPHPPSDGLYGRAALAFRRTPSPDPHSCKSCHRRKVALPLQLDRIHHEPGGKKQARSLSPTMEAQESQSPKECPQKRHISMASKATDAGVGPSNQGKMIPEGSSLRIPAQSQVLYEQIGSSRLAIHCAGGRGIYGSSESQIWNVNSAMLRPTPPILWD